VKICCMIEVSAFAEAVLANQTAFRFSARNSIRPVVAFPIG